MKKLRPIKLTRKHKAGIALAIVAVCTGLALLPGVRVLFEDLEYRVMDYWFILQGPQSTAALPVWVVLIEDESVTGYGFRSPTPRSLIADTLDMLNAKGVRCIGLDYIFDRPHNPEHDRMLEAALSRSRAPVIVVDQVIERFGRLSILAFSEVKSDNRDIVRIYSLLREDPAANPSMAWAMYRACYGSDPPLAAEVDPYSLLLNFYGPPSRLSDASPTFPVVTAKELANLPAAVLQDKIVFVGSGFEDLGDTFRTAFSTAQSGFRLTFGVELHATVIGMLLDGRYLIPAKRWMLVAGMVVLFLLIALSSMFLRTWATVAIGLAVIVGWMGLSAGLFVGAGLVLPAMAPIFFAALVFVLCQSTLYFTESRYSKFLQNTFSRYVSPDIIHEMVDHGWGLDIGGESRHLTIFFTDLEGFTSFAEKLSASDVVMILNEYLARMTDILFEVRGTIGSFIGDAIMAYFGAPAELPDHAARACRAALRMQEAMGPLNDDWRKRGFQGLRMRIGIHTGDVILGNIGSEKRTDFTIIGDSVNLAARLEGVNKYFGTWIIVSEPALSLTGDAFRTRELARIVVKGRTQPVAIHELLHAAADSPAESADGEKYRRYADGLREFYRGDIAGAERIFTENASAFDDAPSRFMMEQCRSLKGQPLPENWGGAVELTSK